MNVNDKAYFLCTKDFYMSVEDGGGLVFKKGKIYIFEYLGLKDFTYVTEEDECGEIHYMGQMDMDNFFKRDDRPSTKILLEGK